MSSGLGDRGMGIGRLEVYRRGGLPMIEVVVKASKNSGGGAS